MIVLRCDREGCDTWQRADTDLPSPFLILSDRDEVIAHFCCIDCLMHWAADHSEPTQVL